MTPRECFITALEGGQPPQVPHWELVFYPTMEALGKVHPEHRVYHQWEQMSETEREAHRLDIAQLYVDCARKYEHAGIMFHCALGWPQAGRESMLCWEKIREISGQDYLILNHGDPTYSLPDGEHMTAFAVRIAEDPQGLKDDAARSVDRCLEHAAVFAEFVSLEGFALCS